MPRPRILVAGTTDAVEALTRALANEADLVPAFSVKEALQRLDAAEFDTIACNVRFDESRMFEFLQAVMERRSAKPARIIAFRVDYLPLSHTRRNAIRNALEALGVEHFVDLSHLHAEYGVDVAFEALRKVMLDETFTPPTPPRE